MRVLLGLIVVFVLALSFPQPGICGKNAGGSLIVHTNDSFSYTTSVCSLFAGQEPTTCEAAITRTDKDDLTPVHIWVIASFVPTATPGVAFVYFGFNHNLPTGQGYFENFGNCGPAGTIEVPDTGWPDTGGNSVAFGSPVTGDTLFAIYYINAYKFDASSYIGTGINPTGGFAAFFDDSPQPVQDDITQFGRIRWDQEGFNDCPVSPGPGACCYLDTSCEVLLQEVCDGDFQGVGTTCEPNLCPIPTGACCFYALCTVVSRSACVENGGAFLGIDMPCDPNPCPPDPGACCLVDGTCTLELEQDCDGQFQGWGVPCSPNPCPVPQGACCFNLLCVQTAEGDCTSNGGTYLGDGTACDPNPCVTPPPMAACCIGGECSVRTQVDCLNHGGVWIPEQVGCESNPCPPTATETTSWGSIKAAFR